MNDSDILTIREFSDATGLSEHTLRYYDKIGLLCPAFRGKNNYRRYTPPQILIAGFVAMLSRLHVPLAAIKELSDNRTPQTVIELLERQQNILISQIFDLQTSYAITQAHRSNIQAGIVACDHDISLRTLDETRMTVGPLADFGADGRLFYKSFIDFCNLKDENKYYPIGGYYEDMNAFLETPSLPTRFFSLNPRGEDKREGGQYLVAHHRGLYRDFGDLPQRTGAYAREKNLSFRGPAYIIYLQDEICEKNDSRYLARLIVGVETAGARPVAKRPAATWAAFA